MEDEVYKGNNGPSPLLLIGGLALIGISLKYGYDHHLFGGAGVAKVPPPGSPPPSGDQGCAALDKQYPLANPAKVGYNFNGPQTVTCIEMQRALQAHNSPMAPFAAQIYAAYAHENINNGAAMGIAWKEGNYGTAGGIQRQDENIGAMRYADPHKYPNPNFTNDNGWMNFHAADTGGRATGWIASAQDHAALIRSWINYNGQWHDTYKHGGDSSVNAIISILSPRTENNTDGYIASVKSTMNTLYSESVDYRRSHPSGDVGNGILATITSRLPSLRRKA